MMRKTPASSMQKTYDESYLICSTAIYFESQNNEAEALRTWRNALDKIYYHNAYQMPGSYIPRSETEKALQDSLHKMELQCKERVDLLETLRKSRQEAEANAKAAGVGGDGPTVKTAPIAAELSTTWLGDNTVPQTSYSDLPRMSLVSDRRPPPQPPRPSYSNKDKASSGDEASRVNSLQQSGSPSLLGVSTAGSGARTPSPEKKGGMLKTLRSNPRDKASSGGKMTTTMRNRPPPAAATAATQVWSGPAPRRPPMPPSNGSSASVIRNSASAPPTWDPKTKSLVRDSRPPVDNRRQSDISVVQPPSPSQFMPPRVSYSSADEYSKARSYPPPYPEYPVANPYAQEAFNHSNDSVETTKAPPVPPPHRSPPPASSATEQLQQQPSSISQITPPSLSYMKEYPNNPPLRSRKQPPLIPSKPTDRTSDSDGPSRQSAPKTVQARSSPGIPRKAVTNTRAVGVASATAERQRLDNTTTQLKGRVPIDPFADFDSTSAAAAPRKANAKRKIEGKPVPPRAMTPPTTDDSPDSDYAESPSAEEEWEKRVKKVMKKLPKGVDEHAAKQIFNEIVIKGDEVHWDDVAGLEPAKSALKETVVYPFLRPDLFMGLREPARGMLLFGPPGTGKTMLARCVATESKSVFFAISASSLTSKFLGESEKLVRALFALAKEMAPSIIFVDEIDSLLGARGDQEHEATRRIKTEFLIGWSDLQKAAAGRDAKPGEGDASRVLVLAATNLPWAIDEAARRRFVRRQYIPLPEDWVREKQLRTLLSAQKHALSDKDLKVLVAVTNGYSGSDITALAKDAAMGPLRSLGERLLHMSPEDIRPIGFQDFEASLLNIRPSVSKQGLKQFEEWAREFGERGG